MVKSKSFVKAELIKPAQGTAVPGAAASGKRPLDPEQEPRPLSSLYVDFNSYFASVEQQLRPELRGLPIAVLPVMTDTTCCIAASYEAKKFGVRTGTGVRDARKMCPGLILIEARPALYVAMHQKLVDTVESCTHVESIHSIDEMACKLMGSERQPARAVKLGRLIKRRIADTVGSELHSSIGIAPNRFLAKTASNMKKPDGLVVIEAADLPDCLYRLELRSLTGIGRSMEKRLNDGGITTVEQLCAKTKDELRHIWGGIEGERYWSKLRGDVVPEQPGDRATVGHSHVLPPELRSTEAARSVLHRLLQKAAMRLRSYHCVASGLALSVKFVKGGRWHVDHRIDPSNDTLALLSAFEALWQGFPLRLSSKQRPLAVGVTLFGLAPASSQSRSLFDNDDARHQLNAMVDSLNLRYGKNTLYYGGAYQSLDAAPMRIAFNHIPDPKLPH
jgi:DNA polymerase-4